MFVLLDSVYLSALFIVFQHIILPLLYISLSAMGFTKERPFGHEA
jgi:hypothetical protein